MVARSSLRLEAPFAQHIFLPGADFFPAQAPAEDA